MQHTKFECHVGAEFDFEGERHKVLSFDLLTLSYTIQNQVTGERLRWGFEMLFDQLGILPTGESAISISGINDDVLIIPMNNETDD